MGQQLQEIAHIDDVGFSAETSTLAKKTKMEVNDILKHGKFSIKKWNSNSTHLDENPENPISDFLGHIWNKVSDTIQLKPKDLHILSFTKQSLSGVVARIWDPVGFFFPVTIGYRINLQTLWKEGYSWDETVSPENVSIWKENLAEMEKLFSFQTQRCLKPDGVIGLPQLHGFSDGGDKAFGACIFLRWETTTGVQLRFVSAKSYVAPLKHKTTPRLELMGLLALCRLMIEVSSALKIDIQFQRFWIDSEDVLYWINSLSSRYKPFVSSPIQEFQDSHPNWKDEVRYVPSEENPADCLTKPIRFEKLESWHQGEMCTFLFLDELSWPQKLDSFDVDSIRPFLEEKTVKNKPQIKWKKKKCTNEISINSIQMLTAGNNTDNSNDLETVNLEAMLLADFHSWPQLRRGVVFIQKCLKLKSFGVDFTFDPMSLRNAEKTLFHICQADLREDLSETKKRFLKLDPVFGEDGLIRANGRLGKTKLSDESKHPIILPGEHPWVRLLAIQKHCELLHQGYRVVTISLANEGILIGCGKELLKSIAATCFFCRTRRRLLLQQQMGTLPSFRVMIRQAPFSSVAIDFFGNLKIKQSRNVSVPG